MMLKPRVLVTGPRDPDTAAKLGEFAEVAVGDLMVPDSRLGPVPEARVLARAPYDPSKRRRKGKTARW